MSSALVKGRLEISLKIFRNGFLFRRLKMENLLEVDFSMGKKEKMHESFPDDIIAEFLDGCELTADYATSSVAYAQEDYGVEELKPTAAEMMDALLRDLEQMERRKRQLNFYLNEVSDTVEVLR